MLVLVGAICLLVAVGVDSQCSEICYDDIECFTDCPPFNIFPLPQSPDRIGTRFGLFSRSNPIGAFIITPQNLGSFEARKTVFLTHGFASSGADGWINNIRADLLEVEDVNVVIVDWADGALPDLDNPFEAVPAANTQVVARQLRNLVLAMKGRGLTEDQVSCVGHSLGAHLCGFFAKEFPENKIDRVTGLDPAGDVFNTVETRVRLSSSDATFVDAIHTDAWSLVPSGIDRNVGHQDYWPNYGNMQPGCFIGICSHFLAIDYYLESIKSECGFISRPCLSFDDMYEGTCINTACSGDDCGRMGYFADTNRELQGTFLLETNENAPYCQECCS